MKAFFGHASRTAGGFVISVAIVFTGSASLAAGLIGDTPDGGGLTGLYGGFSDSELEALEFANSADAVVARIAVLDSAASAQMPAARTRMAGGPAPAEPMADVDLFPHTGRVLPLLVTRPESPALVKPAALRPGLVQPVGVSRASLRSPTPLERAGR